MKKLRCKHCKFYSGVQCHGHGDYWGSCRFVEDVHRFLDLVPGGNSSDFICFDDTVCHFIARFGFVPFDVKYLDEPLED